MDIQEYLKIYARDCYDYNPVGKLFEVEKGRKPKLIKLDKIMFDEENKPEETTPEETPKEEPEKEEEGDDEGD